MISFAIFQILLSQISEFDKFSWLPIVPGVMSFTYSVIALYLGITKVIGMVHVMLESTVIYYIIMSWWLMNLTWMVLVIGNRTVRGSLTGVSIGVMSESQKFWRCFQALGNIASAYSYATILIEIQVQVHSYELDCSDQNWNFTSQSVCSKCEYYKLEYKLKQGLGCYETGQNQITSGRIKNNVEGYFSECLGNKHFLFAMW